jgi:hypothetical protein
VGVGDMCYRPNISSSGEAPAASSLVAPPQRRRCLPKSAGFRLSWLKASPHDLSGLYPALGANTEDSRKVSSDNHSQNRGCASTLLWASMLGPHIHPLIPIAQRVPERRVIPSQLGKEVHSCTH